MDTEIVISGALVDKIGEIISTHLDVSPPAISLEIIVHKIIHEVLLAQRRGEALDNLQPTVSKY